MDDERDYEALERAADAVGGVLDLLSRIPACVITHDHMDEILHMLARVLEQPEVL